MLISINSFLNLLQMSFLINSFLGEPKPMTNIPDQYLLLNSPHSLLSVTLPLLLGVSDETLEQLCLALKVNSTSVQSFVKFVQSESEKLLTTGCVDIVNIMVSRDDIVLRNQYLKSISNLTHHKYFVQGDHDDIVPFINNVVKQSTKGMIDTLLNSEDIDENTFFVLLNTIYFYSDWWSKFAAFDTRPAQFVGEFGKTSEVDMMYKHEEWLQYYEDSVNQIVLLPYKNRTFGFCIVLPKNVTDVPRGHSILERKSQHVSKVIESNHKYVNLSLPKFTQEIELDLIPLFQSLGVTKLFDYTMQTGGMMDVPIDHMALSVIRQKVKIEVNEIGTKASSATTVACGFEGCYMRDPLEVVEFNCNHSFSYLVVNMETQTVLFSGVYK